MAFVGVWGCTDQPTGTGPNPVSPLTQPPSQNESVAYRKVPVKYPITSAPAGAKYTVRLSFYYPSPDKTAVEIANENAEALRKGGEEAYVTDLGGPAIVTIGAFSDPKDPRLLATWRKYYEQYLKIRGGRESSFQQQMDQFFEGSQALGDRPWPIQVSSLQMRMKRIQGLISDAEWQKYLDESMRTTPKPSR